MTFLRSAMTFSISSRIDTTSSRHFPPPVQCPPRQDSESVPPMPHNPPNIAPPLIYIMQWFLEFLGVREPPGAPVPPRREPSKVPKLWETMLNRRLYLIAAYALIVIFQLSISVLYDARQTATMTWTAFGAPAVMVAWFAFGSYTKRRWQRLRTDAKAAGYLLCPSCGHDLRGGTLKGSAQPIPIATDAAESDVVICPECGDSHNVRSLAQLWELTPP